MALYHACGGKWDTLVNQCGIIPKELTSFLEYAATFLCKLSNYYGEGDQKFVPDLTLDALRKIASIGASTKLRLEKVLCPMMAVPPFSLGYPGKDARSAYYPSEEPISPDEIAKVSDAMNRYCIGPENTRVEKLIKDGKPVYQVLQASAEVEASACSEQNLADGIFCVRGDHSEESLKECSSLTNANAYTVKREQTQP
ncbi:hypothetical protein BDV36DRAFT_290911 [Aspergillus pseudocaelatus]|uniref:Uncharacterized protein n=1 Tax=Aspergillus pseudocaelatus TaxID=1825620 RepID=A0ABQ6X0A1_9EURO|nr:hypothetical protein BDV36DRAFT_290911 [Aspergillus pseudocaelatus]